VWLQTSSFSVRAMTRSSFIYNISVEKHIRSRGIYILLNVCNDSIASGGGGKKSNAAYYFVWGRERSGEGRGASRLTPVSLLRE